MDTESDVGVYTIAAVSGLTGLPQSTLRHWEKTYGLVKPTRTSGGHRLYSEADIDRLRWLKHKTVDEGMRSGAAHRLLEQQLSKMGRVAEDATRRGALMILVAEKDPITAELEEYFLKKEGFAVHIVLDGRVAVEEATRLQPDLIILDMILPGLSGVHVCKALKKRRETSQIPILVFSVLDARDRALDAGADAFLLKPIEQPKLIDSVKNLLTQGSSERRDWS